MTPAAVLWAVFGAGPPRAPGTVREWQRAGDSAEEYIDLVTLTRALTDDERAACRLRYGRTITQEVVRHEWGEHGPETTTDRRATLPPYADIAAALGVTPRVAKRRIESAAAKVRAAQARREYTHTAKR